VNADLIEHVEVTPDTVVALTTGQKFLVLESAEQVIEKVIQFRSAILRESGWPFTKDTRFQTADPQAQAAAVLAR
jgi:flagellar protein FlbD